MVITNLISSFIYFPHPHPICIVFFCTLHMERLVFTLRNLNYEAIFIISYVSYEFSLHLIRRWFFFYFCIGWVTWLVCHQFIILPNFSNILGFKYPFLQLLHILSANNFFLQYLFYIRSKYSLRRFFSH